MLKAQILMETTRFYFLFFYFFCECNIEWSISNPIQKQLHFDVQSKSQSTKTDSKDTIFLKNINYFPSCHVQSSEKITSLKFHGSFIVAQQFTILM
jgi:hypothetical protein